MRASRKWNRTIKYGQQQCHIESNRIINVEIILCNNGYVWFDVHFLDNSLWLIQNICIPNQMNVKALPNATLHRVLIRLEYAWHSIWLICAPSKYCNPSKSNDKHDARTTPPPSTSNIYCRLAVVFVFICVVRFAQKSGQIDDVCMFE